MKIWKLLAVALVCVALMMSLIACDSNNNAEGNDTENTEENNSFWDNLWDGILNTFGGNGDNNADNNNDDNTQEPSGDDPTPPVFEGGEGQSPNDAYPDYGQEIIY